MSQMKDVQYRVQSWKCIGANNIECNELLTNINRGKRKKRCTECQYEYRKLKNRQLYYKKMGMEIIAR